ncbi:MAG: class I SAM-dependent methyltransferase [Pseudomonadota bacterium]
MNDVKDPDFQRRREKAMAEVQLLDKDTIHSHPEREAFFENVYQRADGDPAAIPWADLKAKHKLEEWLSANAPHRGCAIDVGCGLGDNAQALMDAGYQTTGFDFSAEAIQWALSRFPNSPVTFTVADLFDVPKDWIERFDLVHECYTLQSIPPETLEKSIPSVVSLVRPGGTLLVYTRVREDNSEVDGPPWPLEETKLKTFFELGLELLNREEFVLERPPDRVIPHVFSVWRKPL